MAPTPAVVHEINEALANPTPGVAFSTVFEICKQNNMVVRLKDVHVSQFFVHPKNRSSLMLSPHNVHRNGARVKRVGADFNQLNNAFAIEMQPSGSLRDAQVLANERLIARSHGLLAKPTRKERYLTLGTGHWTAFCRAVDAGGKTPEPTLQDEEGNIDRQRLFQNQNMKTMVEVGWDWWVFPAEMDTLFPKCSDTAQKALNVSNHIASMIGELESAKLAADTMKDAVGQTVSSDDVQKEMVAAVEATCAPCSPYAASICKFVAVYGGGVDAPQIQFLDAVANAFGCKATLGAGYWSEVANIVFPTKKTQAPILRSAMLLANLTSPKSEDGIAKMLSKIDMRRLASKAKEATVEQAESMLSQAGDVVQVLLDAKKLSYDNSAGPLGRMWVRTALFLCGKEKEGRENKVYGSMAAICSKLLDELSDLVGSKIEYEPWASAQSASNDAAAPSAAEEATPAFRAATLQDHCDPRWKASQAGFEQNCLTYEKSLGMSSAALYKVESIGEVVDLKSVITYDGSPGKTVKVALEVFIEEWTVFKGQAPFMLAPCEVLSRTCAAAPAYAIDAAKANLFQALRKVDTSARTAKCLAYFRRPDELRVTKDMQRGELILTPMAPMSNIVTKKTETSVPLGSYGTVPGVSVEFFLLPISKPPTNELPGEWKAELVLCPYFWVSNVDDEKEATMVRSHVEHSGKSIPTLVNKTTMTPWTKLSVYKPKQQTAPKALTHVVENREAPPPGQGPPTKAPPAKAPPGQESPEELDKRVRYSDELDSFDYEPIMQHRRAHREHYATLHRHLHFINFRRSHFMVQP